jgi:hypothetical protein
MPLNFELLGMIHLAFPRSKILHIRRCPADTCLSIFQNYYGGSASFAYHWENIASYYRAYLRLMELWRTILPSGSMLELDYESLVSDQARTARKTIEFLGLPWDDACLHHEANSETVETPSKWQVRQPIYKRSMGRWRNYTQWFSHLEAMKDLQDPPISNQ